MKKILTATGLLLTAIVIILLVRANTLFQDNQYVVTAPLSAVELDNDAAVQRFANALKIPTVSFDDTSLFDHKAFADFHQYLQTHFPLVYQHANPQTISEYSLVFHLPGSQPQLKPALFMGHMDVVPIDPATRELWQQEPFSGAIIDGTVWGRGAIDDKVTVLALMESLELLLSQNIQPKRSIYFAFGHDEEVGGKGAQAIAEHFKKLGLSFEFVLDEGGAVTNDMIPGPEQAIALVGVAEKGFVNFRLTVNAEGGHSSQPPKNTAAGILSQAIVKVEANQFPAQLTFLDMMFDAIGFASPLSTRLPMANLWLLSPVVKQALLAEPNSAGSIHTTTAVTMLQGSPKSNILPTKATAVVNFRILSGDTIESIQQHLLKVIDDPRVELESFMGNEASVISPTDSYGFKLIEQTIRRLDSEVLVTPYLVQGATDSRHFVELSDNVYRFMMVRLDPVSMKRFHGINEQLSVEDYLQAIQFYYALIAQTAEGS